MDKPNLTEGKLHENLLITVEGEIPLFICAKTQKLNNSYGLTPDSWLTQIYFS